MSRRILITGSRNLANPEISNPVQAEAERDWIFYHLDNLVLRNAFRTESHVAVLSGGSKGVDRAAQQFAEGNDIPFFLYKPYHLVDNVVDYFPRYFFTRNKQLVDNADEIVVFWDDDDNGTSDVLSYAGKRNKPVAVLRPKWEFIDEFKYTDGV